MPRVTTLHIKRIMTAASGVNVNIQGPAAMGGALGNVAVKIWRKARFGGVPISVATPPILAE